MVEEDIRAPDGDSAKKQQNIWKKKNPIYFCIIDYSKAFDCVDHNKLENS